MATDLETQIVEPTGTVPSGPYAGLKPYRFNVREFEQILDAGILHPDKRYELLAGFIVEKMTKHEPHDYGTTMLARRLRRLLGDVDWVIREEKSVALGQSWRPEPDLVVARGPHERYAGRTPGPADIVLVVEVADASYRRDRGLKWRRYAAAGLPVYGILNTSARYFELYGKPVGQGKAARYDERTEYGARDAFPVIIDGVEVGRIAVAELLA
jgi:Uma2 family endonuclease